MRIRRVKLSLSHSAPFVLVALGALTVVGPMRISQAQPEPKRPTAEPAKIDIAAPQSPARPLPGWLRYFEEDFDSPTLPAAIGPSAVAIRRGRFIDQAVHDKRLTGYV